MRRQLIHYLTIRRLVGTLGIIFPVLLIIFGNYLNNCSTIQESLSAYYHTNARDVFVAVMIITGTLFFTYRGYDYTDSILANLAGISAFGIALFPTSSKNISCLISNTYENPLIHYIFAGTFFITLIIFTLFQFTKKSINSLPTSRKKIRNKIYIFCGIVMIISLLLIVIHKFGTKQISVTLNLEKQFTFYMEWIFLIAFGISWLIKGKAILNDQ